ncbi:hypothetical protein HZY62_13925 [Maribacter polysiphoniae]|uniref:Uncharacterized protein n=1 Tax=Maribacter polysiphoniae TaxID=429344 RepID=A0A316DXP0_9FLAO|nr:hypothetical protein [Maribacter polysiphoniae]MBD1261698.1 hypothetical protein [Maribacter polysiphoniae]PWK22496.1 hypothetical protein LX92_02970 [Maribacter polysiphoniae]
MKNTLNLLLIILLIVGCKENKPKSNPKEIAHSAENIPYNGTASVTQGIATTITEDIYACERGRKTDVGEITSTDGKKWTVPAQTNYTDNDFPFSADLFNSCEGKNYATVKEALSHFDDANIMEIDADGEVFTAYIFADNYFEMYVNGVAVGKDKVPFTQFNSSIVKFKAQKPFTIAMKLVDWEEHLGVGCEANRGKSFHAGDGGMVAVIKDAANTIIATTNENWKAQTFYTAPIKDLSCVSEDGNYRYSKNCDTDGGQDGTSFYALHWETPTDWMMTDFNDANWPKATTYTNQTIGVDNKPSYTNFTSIFDDAENDAEFIWSTNVVLDNEVLVRYTVK